MKKYKTDYLDSKANHVLIDTRPAVETEICRLSNSTSILTKLLWRSTVEFMQRYCASEIINLWS